MLGAGAGSLPIPRGLDGAIASVVRADLENKNTSAVVVGILFKRRLVYARAFGNAGIDSTFAVGSITKTFTAVSIMQLASRRQLSLSDHVSKYISRFPTFGSVTIRQLLNHTGGVPNYLDEAVASGKNVSETSPAAILDSMAARPLDFFPGTDWNYSNTGYVLLGQIVERVSGLPLATYEKRNIFEPLGMLRTTAGPERANSPAQPFNGNPGNWSWYYADGNVFSSVGDLARFDDAMIRGKLLSPSLFEAMQQTVPFATFAPGLRDGEGLFVIEGRQVQIVGHHGGMAGFRADNEMVPAKDLAVIVLGNGAYETSPILRAVLRSYFPGYTIERNLGSQLGYDPAPAVTKRATELMREAAAGTLDRSQLEVLANAWLPSNETMKRQLSAFGQFLELRFVSKIYTPVGISYSYRAVFSNRVLTMEITIGKDGKIPSLRVF